MGGSRYAMNYKAVRLLGAVDGVGDGFEGSRCLKPAHSVLHYVLGDGDAVVQPRFLPQEIAVILAYAFEIHLSYCHRGLGDVHCPRLVVFDSRRPGPFADVRDIVALLKSCLVSTANQGIYGFGAEAHHIVAGDVRLDEAVGEVEIAVEGFVAQHSEELVDDVTQIVHCRKVEP